jgi:hypothetical protein
MPERERGGGERERERERERKRDLLRLLLATYTEYFL